MRVTQRSLFDHFVSYMGASTSRLQELNLQASSQRRINRPSDDPVGTNRVLNYRNSLAAMDQYKSNIDAAKGWLSLADETLTQVNTILTRAKVLAEQASTGTVTAENREIIAFEARQLFEQLVGLANSSYEGKKIFAGHKVLENAFEAGLYVSTNDPTAVAEDDILSVTGSASRTILVEFTSSGAINGATYDYSSDGGDTWQTGTVVGNIIDLGTAQVEVDGTSVVTGIAAGDHNDTDGTWLWVRPTAYYQGDDVDTVTVDQYGSTVTAAATGNFPSNVMVRMDNPAGPVALGGGVAIEYSYSTDGGQTWTTGNINDNNTAISGFLVPGGYLNLSAGNVSSGDQFVIRPNTALINAEISFSEKIQLNNIGKDVFGGIYNDEIVFGRGEGKNLFETMGNLVGYLETNTQSGVQEALANIEEAAKHLMSQVASVGARENRLEVAGTVLSGLVLNETERLSRVEDVDLPELMTELSKEQMIYQAVLQSSSMIMKMSLVNYL